MFDRDALRGLLLAFGFPASLIFGPGSGAQLQRWWDDLVGVGGGQAAVAGVDQHLHLWVLTQQRLDALGCDGGGVVHAAGPRHSVAPSASLMSVVLMVFCVALPDMTAVRPHRPARG